MDGLDANQERLCSSSRIPPLLRVGVALADRADGLQYGFREDAMASKKRNRNLDVSTDGDVYLTVLRRSFVRAGTPTSPVKTNTVERVNTLFTIHFSLLTLNS